MLSFPRLGALGLAAVFAGSFASAQLTGPNPIQENDLPLHNGTDIVFLYSDPSVGSSCGSGGVDTSGDLFWKAYPGEALHAANDLGGVDGQPDKELVAFGFSLYDTDWATTPCIYDVLISTGTVGTAAPLAGVITPNFADPNAVLILGGPSGFTDPCLVQPSLCTAGGCPPAGTVNGYIVDAALLGVTCTGDGILMTAARGVNYTVTNFLPGGMTFMSGPPGSCGIGDYAIMDAHSTDETQFVDPAVGPSGQNPYGGFQAGGGAMGPEPATEIAFYTLQFCEPTLSMYVGTDPTEASTSLPGGIKYLNGDAGLQADTTGGTTLRYIVYDEDGLPAGTELCVAAISAFLPKIPAPGVVILGGNLLINPGDPSVTATLRQGFVALENNGGVPFDNGMFQSNPLALPNAPGFTLKAQAFAIDLTVPGLLATETNVFQTETH